MSGARIIRKWDEAKHAYVTAAEALPSTTVLDHPTIRDLPIGSPDGIQLELVPAQGPGTLIVPYVALIGPLVGPTDYTFDPAAAFYLKIGPSGSAFHDNPGVANFLGSNRYIVELGSLASYAGSNVHLPGELNQPLLLEADNGNPGVAFGGGHASNRLTITVLYTVVTQA